MGVMMFGDIRANGAESRGARRLGAVAGDVHSQKGVSGGRQETAVYLSA